MAQALRRFFPSATIAMLVRRYTAEIVEDNRCVDQTVPFDDDRGPIPLFRLSRILRSQRFDVVFHTHPQFRLALLTRFAGIPVRVGTGYRWYSFLFNRRVYEHRKDARYHELEYNLHLLEAIGCRTDPSELVPAIAVRPEARDRVRGLLSDSGIFPGDILVVLHPGSGGSARDWPARNFGELARLLSGLPRVKVLFVGGPSDEAAVSQAASVLESGSTASWVDRLSIREYAALAEAASLFISNSTGPIHIAAAVGTPVIGFYSQITSLSARRWGPYTSKKTIFSPEGKAADCTGCLASKRSGCECMESITPERVYQSAAASVKDHATAKAV